MKKNKKSIEEDILRLLLSDAPNKTALKECIDRFGKNDVLSGIKGLCSRIEHASKKAIVVGGDSTIITVYNKYK
ncbi:MAG TPA: hypothetical protein PKN24_16475 [bacterium]|nr:hypothetical protein [bacterium]